VIDKSETPCAIMKKSSAQSMTVPPLKPSPNDISILVSMTKQWSYLLVPTSGTIRRSRVAHHQIEQYTKVSIPLKQIIKDFKKRALSITAFDTLQKLEKKINAKNNSN
tara:strand:- start:1771 stop:2094 length:324 start_codon:yes stop_codon:yes gene_type:complete